ncbi:phosphate ABC transporter permease [Candidatus Kaiserbacteria bacterium RIFCSPHIGHO2_01_FULL_48_10]|uniref:Transport permease protein n=1 Tax=Candidatus Kaiserbacteria bacterium RIFCSPHIGHO2_01_FULL_48_10 TaxID=1798476 RepID=A0A1F6C6Z6_9BACT|nr:MAG: phosphate ABC transporter permease [Candidatus Kaiserbacteria bacterium RIFCSPHIGHO2_01_FULL_48_10]
MSEASYHITIKPQKGWMGINFKEIWLYRELFYIFVWRDIKVRYKQTAIGILWAILQPFLMMMIFSFVFGRLAKIPSNDIPYPVFVFAGLLFWNYFSSAITNASNVLVEQESMVKKIYFPRLILPISSSLTPLVDFCIAFVILLGLTAYYHYVPNIFGILMIPLLLLLAFVSAAGIGFFLSAINVKYRDIRHALPFFIQILLFVTPVIYPASIIDAKYQWILALNPMTGIIEAVRSLLFQNTPIDIPLFLISMTSGIVLFLFGIFYFRKTERFFADIV